MTHSDTASVLNNVLPKHMRLCLVCCQNSLVCTQNLLYCAHHWFVSGAFVGVFIFVGVVDTISHRCCCFYVPMLQFPAPATDHLPRQTRVFVKFNWGCSLSLSCYRSLYRSAYVRFEFTQETFSFVFRFSFLVLPL